MGKIKITIDGEPYFVNDDGKITIEELLILGQKPKNRLEDYELIRIVEKDGKEEEELIYSKENGKKELSDLVYVKNDDRFIIKSESKPTPAS